MSIGSARPYSVTEVLEEQLRRRQKCAATDFSVESLKSFVRAQRPSLPTDICSWRSRDRVEGDAYQIARSYLHEDKVISSSAKQRINDSRQHGPSLQSSSASGHHQPFLPAVRRLPGQTFCGRNDCSVLRPQQSETIIRGKTIRFGFKLWAICGSDSYCHKFDHYCGKEQRPDLRDQPLGSRVVLDMVSVISDPRGHNLFFDNLFTSRTLLEKLKSRGIRATDTVGENRLDKCRVSSAKELGKQSADPTSSDLRSAPGQVER